jgi:TolB protein
MQEDSSQVTRLTFGTSFDWSPAWSPDGKSLVFQSNRGGDFDIWVMRADGTNPINLTKYAGDDIDPDWSK